MEAWLVGNWEWVLLGFVIAEKVVKLTPWKWDDLVVDPIKDAIKALAGKKA